jgi:prevent-host-death family protein
MKKNKKQPKTEEIGIRELKSRASEVVRAVKEERARYVITQRGKPAALIIPLDAAPPEKSADEVWERLIKIGEELGKGWQSEKSAVEILSEMRR